MFNCPLIFDVIYFIIIIAFTDLFLSGVHFQLTKSDSEDIVDDSCSDLGYQYSPRTYLTFNRDGKLTLIMK